MRPLRSRNDLLAFAAQHAPSTACARAIREGRATIISGVTSADGLTGWRVNVLGKYGQTWAILIYADEDEQKYVTEWI